MIHNAMKQNPWFAIKLAVGCVVLLFIGWISIRYFMGLRGLGYEDSAIVKMRTIVNKESEFGKVHPDIGYTCKLFDVAPDLIIPNGQRNGYAFELINCQDRGNGPNKGYTLTARPLHSDMPAFCANESGILKADYEGSVATCLRNGAPLGS
jgi:hypothetical protein